MKSEINLKITNNTALDLPISILGVIQSQNSLNNITASYEFDMSGETFSPYGFSFRYYSISDPTTSIEKTFINTVPTIKGYVDALNTLNVGLFTYSGTTIYMFSADYIGGSIKI